MSQQTPSNQVLNFASSMLVSVELPGQMIRPQLV